MPDAFDLLEHHPAVLTRCAFCEETFDGSVEDGREWFESHRASAHPDIAAPTPVEGHTPQRIPPQAERLTMTRPSIACCMIVRDEEAMLPGAIASVRPHVDEVCVYDTGSTDRTLELLDEIAAQPGPPLRLERGEWRDDFAWARTQSFAMARSDWLITLDADDELRGGHNLARLTMFAERHRVRSGLLLYDTGDDDAGRPALGWVDRLVRRGSGRWSGAIHEHWIFPNYGKYDPSRMLIANPAALYLFHTKRRGDSHRYLPAIRRAAEDPDRTPRALFYLADQLLSAPAATDDERLANAIEAGMLVDRFLNEERGVDSDGWSLFRLKALEFALDVHRQVGNLLRAREIEQQGAEYLARWREAVESGDAYDAPAFAQWLGKVGAAWENAGRPASDDELYFRLEPRSLTNPERRPGGRPAHKARRKKRSRSAKR